MTTTGLRASDATVEGLRKVIATRFTVALLADVANVFERERNRLTRGFTTWVLAQDWC